MEANLKKYASTLEEEERVVEDIYIGNLPRGLTEQELKGFLNNQDIVASIVRFNGRRGYAIVQSGHISKLQALHNSASIQGRSLIVQKCGDDAMSRLKAICQAERIAMPVLSAQENNDALFIGVATWPAMGGVIIQSASGHKTQKAARQAVAQECLDFMDRQQQDHRPQQEPLQEENGSTEGNHTEENDDDGLVPLVINLIDSPGHIEFNAEVSAALRVSDGALLVVDAVEGKAVQTEQVLIQALNEGVTPVLMLNKVDRLFIDKQFDPEEIYDNMQRVVDDINSFIAAHQLEGLPDQQVSFVDGSVCFGSGYFGWSCSIDSFLHLFQKTGSEEENRAIRKSLSKRENFIKHIIKPIMRMHRAAGVLPSLKKDLEDVDGLTRVNELLSKIPMASTPRLVKADKDAQDLAPRKLLKKAMMTWLPAADALVDMIASHVPSPVHAQRMRAELLYSGPISDDCGQGIYHCDPLGPTVVYISKMSPPIGTQNKRLLAYGRVFSGTIRSGDVVRALRTDGSESKAKITQIKICGIKRMHNTDSSQAGELVALEGVDEALSKAGTLTSSLEGCAIRHMQMAVTPILQHSVRPKDKRNLVKMVAELHRIVSADATAVFYRDRETEEYILAGAGELHIEVLVSALLQNSGIEIELSEPIISYRETVQDASKETALAKSDNKHNRVYMKALPLADEINEALTSGELVGLDCKAVGRKLVSKYGWASNEASRIWAIGPEPLSHGDEMTDTDQPTCLLVDSTFGLQIPQDVRENIISAFQQVVREGVLVNAPMRGVRFDMVDGKFHPDSVHRRPNSVVPAASRAMRGAFLMANPTLVEPMYRADISGTFGMLNGAYSVLGQRSAVIVDTARSSSSESIQARLPVRCAFGLGDALRLATQGHAHCYLVYDGMSFVSAVVENDIIVATRKSKSLKEELPVAEAFLDRLN